MIKKTVVLLLILFSLQTTLTMDSSKKGTLATFLDESLLVVASNLEIDQKMRMAYVLAFLNAGANTDAKDKHGKTAYDYCPQFHFLKPKHESKL